MKVLLDQGNQWSYITEYIIFGIKHVKEEVTKGFNVKNFLGNYFTIETLCTKFICFLLKNQHVKFTQKITHICWN